MKLKDYLKTYDIDPTAFAVKAGISVSSLYRFLRGHTPNRTTARSIEKATNGIVTYQELRGINEQG